MTGRLEQTERQMDEPLNSGIGKEASLASVCERNFTCRLVVKFQIRSTIPKIWGNTKLLGSLTERCENMAVKSIKIDL